MSNCRDLWHDPNSSSRAFYSRCPSCGDSTATASDIEAAVQSMIDTLTRKIDYDSDSWGFVPNSPDDLFERDPDEYYRMKNKLIQESRLNEAPNQEKRK